MKELLKEFITDILSLSEAVPATHNPGDVWRTKGGFGAKNQVGNTDYFKDKKTADVFARGRQKSAPNKTVKKTTVAKIKPKSSTAPQRQEVPTSNAPGRIPPKPLTAGSAARDESILSDTETKMRVRGFTTKIDEKRFTTFTKLWRAFIGAPNYEEQVRAVRALADQKMIEGGASGKKIYMTAITGLEPKHMCGQAGTAVTKLMNDIITREGIEIGMRGNAADRALADLSGKHNEAGVTFHLSSTAENKNNYNSVISRYKQLGGDHLSADARNKTAAAAVLKALPKGAKITSCIQVGGIGKDALNSLGIDPKTDPTDILLKYEVGNQKRMMKISAKIYTDPRNITMKNSGVKRAGVDYLGEPEGSRVDTLWPKLLKKYKWTPDMPEEEKVKLKSGLKQSYLKLYAAEMENLSKTPKGQQRLLNMWRSVHGCGKDVSTLVINKTTNQAELKPPTYYCDPKIPFKIKYDGIKVVIEMNTGGPQTLQIDLKTEDKGSPKLLFRHIVRDKK